jgi:large subunit ribosomal protein L29
MKLLELMAQLRGMSVEDLRLRARELNDQVFRLRLQKSMGQSEAGSKIRPLRREAARVHTVLREKGVKD